ncbi:MAG: YlxM family DNA-binding protein [Ruminococcus sp.]
MCKVILDYTEQEHDMAKELKFVLLLDCYGELLTEHQRNVMELYYCDDLSLSEIGEPMGITRQGVRALIKRTEGLLLNYEEKLGFAGRLGKMRSCFEALEESAAQINDAELSARITEQIHKGMELL